MWTLKQLKDILLRKADYSNSALIAWPVVYPEALLPPDNPHVTVIYIPDVTNVEKSDVLDAIRATEFDVFPVVETTGIEMFGPDKDVPVIRVKHEYLEAYYEQIAFQLEARGIEFSTLYDYSPHVTMSEKAYKTNAEVPPAFMLLPVSLWWKGTKEKVFR